VNPYSRASPPDEKEPPFRRRSSGSAAVEGGVEVAFHGEYREIVPNERLVSTEVYEAYPDAAALDTLTLAEADGRTTMTILVEHASREHRDAHIESGMEDGLQKALDLLEEVARSLRSA
jgi:uncharacterized protein YndB with AHSA1/START domain